MVVLFLDYSGTIFALLLSNHTADTKVFKNNISLIPELSHFNQIRLTLYITSIYSNL